METAIPSKGSESGSVSLDPVAGGTLASPVASHGRVIKPRPQLPLDDHELRARIQWVHRSSNHFHLSYDRTSFNEHRAAMLNESLEIAYSLIFHFTHESFTDRFQVYAIDERSSGVLGRAVWPHFNLEERAIYLVESSSRPLQSELAGLLAHAMRIHRYSKHYWGTPGWAALEEGFSIFLSERLSIQPDIFPFFDAEPDLVAHHLHSRIGTHLTEIWNESPQNLILEHRILTGAFILYLGDTFGDDQVVTFSKSDDPITSDTFRSFFGSSLSDLEAGWFQYFPVALLALTESEREAMLQHWSRSVESCYHH